MKRISKAIFILPTLLLSACNFKFTYNIVGFQGAGDIGGDIWEDPSGLDDSGTYNIKIWVDEKIEALTRAQIGSFTMAYNGKYTINANIEPMSEGNAATSMLQDVQNGADIFCFAQDQLARLKVAGAITKLPSSLTEYLKGKNSADSIAAASLKNGLYALPTTSDNGYFLYYDKRVVSDEEAKNMTTLLAALKRNGKKLNFEGRSNGFYAASYFLGTGCHSNWTIDEVSGKFTSYDDNYNSENGVIAGKALREIADSSVVATRSSYTNTCGAVISGIWEYEACKEELGDNLGCAELPNFTVDGQTYHMSSFDGYKLMGVKPQVDTKKASVCRKLAQFLTNAASQKERFQTVAWGPTNIEASAEPDVLAHPGLAALAKQHEYATQQGQCPGAWFVALQATATAITASSTEQQIRATLATYAAGLPDLLSED